MSYKLTEKDILVLQKFNLLQKISDPKEHRMFLEAGEGALKESFRIVGIKSPTRRELTSMIAGIYLAIRLIESEKHLKSITGLEGSHQKEYLESFWGLCLTKLQELESKIDGTLRTPEEAN